MTEYLPDKTPESSHESHRKHSTAGSRSFSSTGRASRSGSTVESGGGGGSGHSTARSRRQSAYPNYNRPAASAHSRRYTQHSVAYPPRRSTFSDDKIAESVFSSSSSSKQFNVVVATSSPSGIRHSRTEPIADQVALLSMSNNITSRSSQVVDEVVSRSRRGTGGTLSPGAAGRQSTANVCRVLSSFDEHGEPSPTSLSHSSTSRGDSSSSPAPLHEGSSGQSNAETAAPAADSRPPTVVLHVSASTRADLVEIRTMLSTYMKRLADKDAAASVTKEWRIVAKVFDRLFFFLYCATIIVSLNTIFPRA